MVGRRFFSGDHGLIQPPRTAEGYILVMPALTNRRGEMPIGAVVKILWELDEVGRKHQALGRITSALTLRRCLSVCFQQAQPALMAPTSDHMTVNVHRGCDGLRLADHHLNVGNYSWMGAVAVTAS